MRDNHSPFLMICFRTFLFFLSTPGVMKRTADAFVYVVSTGFNCHGLKVDHLSARPNYHHVE